MGRYLVNSETDDCRLSLCYVAGLYWHRRQLTGRSHIPFTTSCAWCYTLDTSRRQVAVSWRILLLRGPGDGQQAAWTKKVAASLLHAHCQTLPTHKPVTDGWIQLTTAGHCLDCRFASHTPPDSVRWPADPIPCRQCQWPPALSQTADHPRWRLCRHYISKANWPISHDSFRHRAVTD